MKTAVITFILLTTFQLSTLFGQSARVQIIHNSADAAAASVDIWKDNTPLETDFNFREATPFIDVDAGVDFDIVIQPAGSTDTVAPVARFTYNLVADETYILIANGIVSGSGYDPAPAFDIDVYAMGREAAETAGNTDVLVYHGSTDAPTVDIYELTAGELVNDAAYQDFSGYLPLETADYVIEVRDETAENIVASYSAPLSTLGLDDAAITVLASGFLNPANNSNGAAFGLFVALADGGNLVPLPVYEAPTARVQVIHNSADMAAASVDIWLDDEPLLTDFDFREASPFIDAPAGVDFDITIQPAGSMDTIAPVARFTYNLMEDETYILVANGIVSAEGYDPAPAFNIDVYAMGREAAETAGNTDVLVYHGSTDAPTVDIYEMTAGELVNDAAYQDFAGYLPLETADYVIEVRDETAENIVASYSAPLSTLGLDDAAITVLASGFLNPANNSNGAAFGLFVALADGGNLVPLPVYEAPTARVQVIHNSADMAAASVDIWLDDEPLLTDFDFREASPFIDAPAGVDFDITIQPAGSMDTIAPVARFTYNLMEDETYLLVANGIVSAEGYDPATPFDIDVYPMGREEATSATNTDILVYHGSTDAPTVEIAEKTAGVLVDDIAYSEFEGYLELLTTNYVIDVNAGSQVSSTVASFEAPLETLGLEGQAITVLASGFLDPANNNDGAPFGLYVALAEGGDLIALPPYEMPTARVQVIHNSADMAAASVDVWLDDMPLLTDFDFREASPFIDAPAGVDFDITIQPAGSVDTVATVARFTYNLMEDETYILIANGIVSAEGYDPAPAFNIDVYAMGREMAAETGNTDVLVYHGSTDAPTVDVYEMTAGELVNDASYGDFAGYLELTTSDYVIEVRDGTGESIVASYAAPLSTLGLDNAAITVLASGFLNPANNNDGAPFGLFVALADGGDLVPLPVYEMPTARVQVIHNSADMAAASVDIWIDDMPLLTDFDFREASPFIDAPAGVDFDITIQPAGSVDTVAPVARFTYNLMEDETYILIANGIVSAEGYDPAPAFNIDVYAMGREMASTTGNTDVLVYHGSTDAPTVDIYEMTAGELVNDASYGDFAGYLELTTADYVIEVRDGTGESIIASYAAPLSTLGLDDAAITVLASGFLNPANNSDGAPFGLYVALAEGGDLLELPIYTSIEAGIEPSDFKLYPNPVNDILSIQIPTEAANEPASIEVYDIIGNLVYTNSMETGTTLHTVNLSGLNNGMYLVKYVVGNLRVVNKIEKVN